MSADSATPYTDGGSDWSETKAIAAAEAALAEIQRNFGGWVAEDMDQALAAFERTRAAGDPVTRAEAAHGIYTAAHNIKGYAATFGYQLVTDIADSLCRLVRSIEDMTPEALALAETHLERLGTIIADEATGDGGEAGRAVLAELTSAIDRIANAG